MTSNMNSALDKFVETGKLSFNDLARSIIMDLIKIQVRKAAAGFVGMLFGPKGFADGGDPPVGRASIVGERGPELFVPKVAGTIIPNHRLALTNGGATAMRQPQQPVTVNYNIQAVDASSFRSLVARDPGFIYAVTEQGRRSQPTRRA
jgi:phage-related minor tail protein